MMELITAIITVAVSVFTMLAIVRKYARTIGDEVREYMKDREAVKQEVIAVITHNSVPRVTLSMSGCVR